MKPFCRQVDQKNFLQIEIKVHVDVDTLQRFLLQKEKKMIFFCKIIKGSTNCKAGITFLLAGAGTFVQM